jgi:signal transduction histidine kinase/ActR/RegA family two-component response regulator
MAPAESFAKIAAVRRREIGVRLALGAFIGAAAFILAPSFWPAAWYAAVVATQFFDRMIGARVETPSDEGLRRRTVAYVSAVALNTATYGSICIYFWLACGEPGAWFALLICAGGMLHVSLRAYPSKWMLVAGAGPHALFLFAMPVITMTLRPGNDLLAGAVVTVGGLLYGLQLVTGVRQSRAFVDSLTAANDQANAARDLAERASAAKSEFLATVSHEIRTPMNAVLSAAHLLKRTTLTAQQQDHVAMLTNGGEVLVGLLNDVLDISKIEAGKMMMEEADLDLGEALGSLIKLYQDKAAAKGVDLALNAAANLPAAVRTDPLRLRQILFNLLSNAVKFTDHGQIAVSAGRMVRHGAEILWFEVKDSGIGIDTEAMSRLFRSFEQAKAETARNHGGTGLGLAISRRLAEMMGGGLVCHSVVGEGSTFRLELPLIAVAAKAPAAPAPQAVDPSEVGDLSILVAEDHEVNRKIVGLFLEPLGWRLTMAKDGGEAVAMAAREPFDAILMDMQMPVLNGVDAALAIRAGGGPNATAPIIALTANALGHHQEAWNPVGVAAFLTKPINPELLVETLLLATAGRSDRLTAAEAA